MSKWNFYFDSDTIDYYVEMSENLGPFRASFEIYKYVADWCEWVDEGDMRVLYLDLLSQVEDIVKQKAKL